MKNKKEIIKDLELQINEMLISSDNMDEADWNHQLGIIITGNEAKLIVNKLKKKV